MSGSQTGGPLATPPDDGFTFRAVATGCALGAVLGIGNVYMGLKTGWWDAGTVTASLLGFALLKPLSRWRGGPYTLLENNITQTAAASASTMPSAVGLLGAVPALALLGSHFSAWVLIAWGLLLSAFGIAMALPLREELVVKGQLPFPSAIATAEVLRAIHGAAATATRRMRALLGTGSVAMAMVWLRDGKPAVLPATLSPMLFCTGALVGLRNGLSLLVGAGVAWGLVAPWLVRQHHAQDDYSSVVNWLIWPAAALMVASGLTSMAIQWRALWHALRPLLRQATPGEATGGTAAPWVAGSGAAVVLAGWVFFGLHPMIGLLGVLGSLFLVRVCVRTAGETDIAPFGSIGQIVQLVHGGASAGAVGNVADASIASGAAAQTTLTMYAFKVGHLLGAPFRPQVRAQVLGALVGSLVVVPAYALVTAAWGIGTKALPAPFALAWKALAELGANGLSTLPGDAALACALAAALGVALTLLEGTRAKAWVPSPFALAVALLVPLASSVAIALGAAAGAAVGWRFPRWAEEELASWAAGGIAGESLMGVLIAALMVAGVL